MWMTWRSILPSILMLTVVLPLYPSGAMPNLQEPSSGATSSKHDSIIEGTFTSNGERQKNAHVTLTNLATEEKTETQTDKSGRFQFSGLYSGKYNLEARTEGGETASEEVSLGGSETVVRNLTLFVGLQVSIQAVDYPKKSASSGATSSKHHSVIKGEVTAANGEPQKYARVTLINLETEEKRWMLTDKSGRFEFYQLYSDEYRLEVKTERGETASYEFSLGSIGTFVRKLVVKRQE